MDFSKAVFKGQVREGVTGQEIILCKILWLIDGEVQGSVIGVNIINTEVPIGLGAMWSRSSSSQLLFSTGFI